MDRIILHSVVHHSSTSTYMPNFIEMEETFVDGWTYIWTDGSSQVQSHVTQKLGQISKIWPIKFRYCALV